MPDLEDEDAAHEALLAEMRAKDINPRIGWTRFDKITIDDSNATGEFFDLTPPGGWTEETGGQGS